MRDLQAYRAADPAKPRLAVVGAVNLDHVLTCDRLPKSGETLIASSLERIPGGKGANQALACARLGASVTLIAAIGRDKVADEALEHLGSLSLSLEYTEAPTGMAFILVDTNGENVIAVVAGANALLRDIKLPPVDAVLTQLEISDAAIESAYASHSGFFCLNASPARSFPAIVPDLTIVNEHEFAALPTLTGWVAVTYGSRGAALFLGDAMVARADSPAVSVRDGTAAGDAFAASLVVSILQGRSPTEALTRACVAGSIAVTRLGAQTSLPYAHEIDAAIAAAV